MDHGGLLGDVPDLLPGSITLHWHRHCVACSSLLSLLFASFLAPIRVRLGCVEKNPGSGDDYSAASANDRSGLADCANSGNDFASPAKSAGIAESTRAFVVSAARVTATTNMKALANNTPDVGNQGPEASMFTRAFAYRPAN